MNEYAVATAKRGLPTPAHRIAAIDYSEDRLECSCGAVMRAAGAVEYRAHRVAVGAPSLTLSTAYGKGRR